MCISLSHSTPFCRAFQPVINGNVVWVSCPKIGAELDFKDFWDNTLSKLRKIPLDPKIERVECFKEVPGFEIYQLSFNPPASQIVHRMLSRRKS